MVEQLLDGTESSVQTMSAGGRRAVRAITGKDVGNGVVELGHVVPAVLDEPDAAAAPGSHRAPAGRYRLGRGHRPYRDHHHR